MILNLVRAYKMSGSSAAANRTPSGKAVCASEGMLSTPRSSSREKSKSWSDVTKMPPNDRKMTSMKPSTPRGSGSKNTGIANGSSSFKQTGSPRRSMSNESKGVLSREKMSNGLSSQKISINVSEDGDSEMDEARDNVFSPIGDKPLISILKVPGRNRARSKSLPPNMILQQLSEGMSALGPNSKLAGLLKIESSEEGSMESLEPPGYLFANRKVSFSLPRDSDDSGSGCSTPSSHLLPLLTGHGGRLSPSIVIAEQGNSRRSTQFYFDNSSSESLDSDHRSPINSRPSSAPKDIQRTPLPTGSSIFQKAMAEVSDSSDRNSDSSDSESTEDRSRSKTNKHINRTTKPAGRTNYLTAEYRVPNSTSPRRLSNSGASPRRIDPSPRRAGPSPGVSPRRPSKSDSSGSRRT